VAVPKRSQGRTVHYEAKLAGRLKRERELRGWSVEKVAELMTEAGCAMSGSAVWGIEQDPPRRITVDEYLTFAKVYGVRPDDLLLGADLVDNAAVRRELDRLETKAMDASFELAGFLSRYEQFVRAHLPAVPLVADKIESLWPWQQGSLEIDGATVRWEWTVPI
jgi:transcriptional regulator with XRE-family HTH domain